MPRQQDQPHGRSGSVLRSRARPTVAKLSAVPLQRGGKSRQLSRGSRFSFTVALHPGRAAGPAPLSLSSFIAQQTNLTATRCRAAGPAPLSLSRPRAPLFANRGNRPVLPSPSPLRWHVRGSGGTSSCSVRRHGLAVPGRGCPRDSAQPGQLSQLLKPSGSLHRSLRSLLMTI